MEVRGLLWQRFYLAALLCLSICGWVLPGQALAWETVSSEIIEISQSTALYNRYTNTYVSTVTATNISASDIVGEFRLVVDSTTKAVHDPDGTTAGSEPFFDLLSGEDAQLSVGQTLSKSLVFDGGRGGLVYTVRLENNPPALAQPGIMVSPETLDFGEILVGNPVTKEIIIQETGDADLSITGIASDNSIFILFPPTAFTINDGGGTRSVSIQCAPVEAGAHTGTINISHNAGPPVAVQVSCSAVAPVLAGDIAAPGSLEFGSVQEEDTVSKAITVSNCAPSGSGPIVVTSAATDHTAFLVAPSPSNNFPFTLGPGESRNVYLDFTPSAGSGGKTVAGNLSLDCDDPDEPVLAVKLSGNSVAPFVAPANNPILSAVVNGPITADNCASTGVNLLFGTDASSSDNYQVIVRDVQTNEVGSGLLVPPEGGGAANIALDTCTLVDGPINVLVAYVKGGSPLPDFKGSPTTKNTSVFPAPVLDPLAPVSVFGTIQVCGSSRQNTTVVINGGATPVSITLDDATTNFCVNVPLRRNTQNTLVATAFDDTAPAPRPTASAQSVQVVHIDPSEIVIAEASSRPLTVQEIETLVANNVIQLDDPSNFNVSMFTIVLTIGQFPVTISQPVAVNPNPGTVSYGGGGGWSGGGGGGGGGGTAPGSGSSSQVVIIKPPQGPTIPGVIIIDGRIKTLKEFFQVTIAIQNTSENFALKDVAADINLPSGLSPLRSGPGTDVATISTTSAIDHIDLGAIGPLSTGTGQFIIRGDGIGTHNVEVDFSGFIVGGGLPDPYPFDGTVGTTVQVFGPPELDVLVRHPSHAGTHDVELNEIYTLTVELTNRSPVPALYTSLELMVGGNALLVDENNDPIPDSISVRDFGHIQPGQTVIAAFRVKSLVQGEIIACQAVTSENINLSVDTGPDGTDCNIANSIPVNFDFPEGSSPPILMAINPLNGQFDIPVTTSILAILTPPSACITADTWTNVVTENIDPADPSKGVHIVSADLVSTGTFYLEEMDPLNNPVRHIPTELYLETGVGGDTTIAVLRLGLRDPVSQYFLKDNTTYRATLVGGLNGICNEVSNVKMESSYSWTFSTQQTCDAADRPIADLIIPLDGSDQRPLNQPIEIDFTNRMNPGSFAFVPGNLAASTFGVYQNPTLNGTGDDLLAEGTLVPGSGVFRNLNRTLIYTPTITLAEDSQIFIRLTDGLKDVCNNSLVTAPNGTQLFSFATILPDTIAPAAPVVNPIALLTNANTVQVTGSAEADATIQITGGSSVVSQAVSGSGLFTVSVPLNSDQTYNLQVTAEDSSGNLSDTTTLDTNGDPLSIRRDTTPPSVASFAPANGANDVGVDAVILVNFNEPVKPETINNLNFTLEGSVVPGSFALAGANGFTFTPDSPLEFSHAYTARIRANGIRDLAGNGLGADFSFSFTTLSAPVPVLSNVTPDNGVQGTGFSVTFTGSNLGSATNIVSGNPGISGTITSASDALVTADITIDTNAAAGATTLGVLTPNGPLYLPFTVLHKAPVIAGLTPAWGDQGTIVSAQITGTGLADFTDISITGTNVVVNTTGPNTDSLVEIEIVIGANALPGPRTITVTTPGGSDTSSFTINKVYFLPTISSILPGGTIPDTTITALIQGTSLDDSPIVSIDGTGVIIADLGTGSSTVLNVELVIDPAAPLGPRTITISTIGGSAAIGFEIVPPPSPALVNPLAQLLTNQASVQVTGSADAGATILVRGGASEVSVPAMGDGSFSISVPLTIDAVNFLEVIAANSYGYQSAPVTTDSAGDLLVVTQDSTPPAVISITPGAGEIDIALDTSILIEFNEDMDPATLTDANIILEGSVIPGSLVITGNTAVTFVPDAPLLPSRTYTLRMPVPGVTDAAGNNLAAEYTSSFTTVTTVPVDLNTWSREGVPANGNWGVSADGQTVLQTINGNPTFFISPDPVINQTITGKFKVETTSDDDFIGFVFGFQAPRAANSDNTNDFDFWLFDWKKGAQSSGGYTAQEGFALSRVRGLITEYIPGFWGHSTSLQFSVADTDYGSTRGWVSNTEYNFKLVYNSDLIQISIQGGSGDFATEQVIFEITPADVGEQAFINGRFGFYNYSQPSVRYSGFVQAFTTPPPAPALTLLDPAEASPGESKDILFQGTELYTAFEVISDNPGIKGRIKGFTPEGYLVAGLSIDPLAPAGPSTLGLTTFGGSHSMLFTVGQEPPVITSMVPDQGVQGQTVSAQIQGSVLMNIDSITIDGTGVSITDLGTGSDTALDVELAISDTAPAGTRTITVTTPGGVATAEFEVIGKSIGLTPESLSMLTMETFSMTANINAPAPAGGQVLDLAPNNARITAPASVVIPEGATSIDFDITSGTTTGFVTLTASAAGYAPDSSSINVLTRDYTLASPLVGIGRTVTAYVNLANPAPAGGASFELSVADTGIATVSPATITIAQGGTTGSFELTGIAQGNTIVTADGSASGYPIKTLAISATNRLIDIPAGKEAFLGEEFQVQVLIAPDTAPAGGVEITIESSNSGLVQVLTPVVTVPEGSYTAMVTLKAAPDAKGMATITASNPGFAPDTMDVSITASLNIVETFSQFTSAETNTINVQIMSGGAPFYAPAGGITLSLTSDNPTCVGVTSSVTIAEGQSYGIASLSYTGSGSSLPCTATITATHALLGTDTLTATVHEQVPDLGAITLQDYGTYGDRIIGSGLQLRCRMVLDTAAHGGIVVQIQSSNSSLALLSSGETAPGQPVIEVAVPDGQNIVYFYTQARQNASGNVTITARNERFINGTLALEVKPPVFHIYGLNITATSLSADDPFYVASGYLYGTSFRYQNVSGTAPLLVSVSSSNSSVGQLATLIATGPSLDIEIAPGTYYTPTNVASGGMAFDAMAAGTTTISAARPESPAYSGSSVEVNVSQPGIVINDWHHGDFRIGSSLQKPMYFTLGGSDHGGVTVTLTSSDPSVAKLSSDPNAAGAGSIDVDVPDGTTQVAFYVQGVAEATGSVTLTASSPLFSNGTKDVTVVPSVFYLYGLNATTTTLSSDDPFQIQAGYPNTSGTNYNWAYVSGASDLDVTFTSSNTAAGVVKTLDNSGGSVTITMPKNTYYSPSTLAAGGVAFDPVGGGTAIVAATAPGFNDTWFQSGVEVTVSQPGIIINDWHHGDFRIGSSLQKPMYFTLGGADHGGVTVTLTSSDPSVARLSSDPTAAGAGSIDVVVPDGTTQVAFYVQGVAEATGSVTLTASSPLFSDSTADMTVVQPVFYIYYLNAATTTLSADDPFQIQPGYPNTSGTNYNWAYVSGASDLDVTLTSDNTAAGVVKTLDNSGGSVTITMPKNTYYTPSTLAAGGVAFDPVGGGTAIVAATAPGFDDTWFQSGVEVTVSQPGIIINDWHHGDFRIGSSLQKPMYFTLGGADHGGVTVTLTSSDPSVARLSSDPTAAGAGSIDVAVPDGTTQVAFYVQGVAEATGSVTLTASSPLFSDSTADMTVVQPVFYIYYLNAATTTLSADDPFQIQPGYPNTSGTNYNWAYVSGASDLDVTLTSDNTAAGVVKTLDNSGGSVTITMPKNSYYSPSNLASGGVVFDPVGQGTARISASATGFDDTWFQAAIDVVVSQPAITLSDINYAYYQVGGLQDRYRVTLGGSDHGGVNIRISSSDPAKILVSPNTTTSGTSFIEIFIPDGSSYADFSLQGISGVTGNVTITASHASFTSGTMDITLVQPVLDIYYLDTNPSSTAGDDPFQIRIGLQNTAGTGIQEWQTVSPTAAIQVIVSSSNTAAGDLNTAAQSGGGTVTVEIPENSYYSPATVIDGGVAFDPVAPGTTVVYASSSGFDNTFPQSSETVVVGP